MLKVLLTASSYFYFHNRYFRLTKELRQEACLREWFILISFVVNYAFFFVCSIMESPLIANWFLFAFLLLFETVVYNRGEWRNALFVTFLGIINGLSVNIFCRSIIAIIINQPLRNFDNQISSAGNLKSIPIFWGFLLAGVVLHAFSRPILRKRLSLILSYPQHQTFLMGMMTGLFFYLFLNLLLYSTPNNSLLLKIWSIKSCLFSVVGFYIAIRYTKRICELSEYREKNRRINEELKVKQKEEENLRQEAIHDMLTGLFNRQYAEEKITSLMEKNVDFSLCFLDLDGLKNVNDQYGHLAGDRYIKAAVSQLCRACRDKEDLLFRYGGDEFLILFPGMAAKTAEERMEAVNEKLRSLTGENFPLSISYGVTESGSYTDWKELVQDADRKMYIQKQRRWGERESGTIE